VLHVVYEVLYPQTQVLDRHHDMHIHVFLPLEVGGVAEGVSPLW
jgi:hypothetical protein